MDIQLVVVNYKTYDLLDSFIESVHHYYPELVPNLWVVDVESDLRIVNGVIPTQHVTYIRNVGYAKACNDVAAESDSEFIAFFNSDTKFINDTCIPTCIESFDDPAVGAVGPKQIGDGVITHAGIVGSNENPQHRGWRSPLIGEFNDVVECVTVSGAAYFVRRSAWDKLTECDIYQRVFPEVNGAFLPTKLYYEETGCSYHMRDHGYKILYNGNAVMVHRWDGSAKAGHTGNKHAVNESKQIFGNFCDAHDIAWNR